MKIQDEVKPLAEDVIRCDGVELRLRVGLNSGEVIAGEIGSGTFGYTTIGEQVGMAQRMESVAPPGGIMLSGSTARLVDSVALLGEPEMVHIKGADEAVPARRLLGMGDQLRAVGQAESGLVGRRWEMSTVEGLLDRAIAHHGGVSAWWAKQVLARPVSWVTFLRPRPRVVSRCSQRSASRTPAISRFNWWPASCARSRVLAISPATQRAAVYALDFLGQMRKTFCY